ncbi:MAG: hypothetical protein H8D22_01865 [Candidatus Cloacimonetes bacterium]|nr:hypothetical protein [Candidatus Cloacimonadota bacterium]
MPLSKSDTRAKLIDPALHRCGWTEDLIRREETEKGIYVVDGKPQRREGRIDRIGSEYEIIWVYNFLPHKKVEDKISLKERK